MTMLAPLTAAAERRRFVVYLAVGGLNTAVGYGIFAAFILLGAGLTIAAIGTTVLGIAFNFGSIGRIVFGSGKMRALPRFLGVYALQCAGNIALLRLGAAAGVPLLIAELFIIPVLAVAAFLLMRRFVFVQPGGDT